MLADALCIEIDHTYAAVDKRCDVIKIKVRPLDLANGRGSATGDDRVSRFWNELRSID